MNRDDGDAAPTTHDDVDDQEKPWLESAGYGALIPPPAARTSPRTDYTSWLTRTDSSGPADDLTDALTGADEPPPPAAKVAARRGGLRWGWGAAAALAVGVCVAAALAVTGPRPDPAAAPAAVNSTASAPSAVTSSPPPPVRCANSSSAERVTGNGPGSTESGPQAILALEHAYYGIRRASAVRVLLAPDGPFGTDAEIQAGIDAVPAGTTHCVEITSAEADRWAVVVSEHRPDGTDVAHRQTILTTTTDGQTRIKAVEAA